MMRASKFARDLDAMSDNMPDYEATMRLIEAENINI